MTRQILSLDLGSDVGCQPAAYLSQGQGEPLLMLHGFLGQAACWQPLITQLQSQAWCIGLDLLGFGQSGKPKLRYDVAQEVAFVRQFMARLSLKSCYLVGHSFGGWVAAAYALAYPEAVKGLILVGPAGIRDDSFCGRYDHLRPLLWETPLIDGLLAVARSLSRAIGQKATVDQLTWFRRELMAEPAARSFLVDRLRPEDAIDTVENDIHRLRVPTLVIAGEKDETIPLWHCQTYANTIPGAQLVTIPNASHALPQNHAADLAPLILSFLARRNHSSFPT
jgi:pimeloyl-ACP methyl ester carboxylesterase